MKRSYFDSILKTFQIFNPFIQNIGDLEYEILLNKVEA
jgi:hypothetical protein